MVLTGDLWELLNYRRNPWKDSLKFRSREGEKFRGELTASSTPVLQGHFKLGFSQRKANRATDF